MKRLASVVIALCVFLGLSAQENNTFRFGYLSYEAAIQSMPEYAGVQQQMKTLQEQYQAETLRVEDEFNRKYEDFLDGQRDFPRTILLKRQNELQELLQKNIAFKQQGQADLKKAEEEALQPLRQRLAEVLASVARENKLLLIVNTDQNACPFIDPDRSCNVTEDVMRMLENEKWKNEK
jgi:outer membrane protein